jgi:hypothetical protein
LIENNLKEDGGTKELNLTIVKIIVENSWHQQLGIGRMKQKDVFLENYFLLEKVSNKWDCTVDP